MVHWYDHFPEWLDYVDLLHHSNRWLHNKVFWRVIGRGAHLGEEPYIESECDYGIGFTAPLLGKRSATLGVYINPWSWGLGICLVRRHSRLPCEQPSRNQRRCANVQLEFWHFWSNCFVLSCVCSALQCAQSLLRASKSYTCTLDCAGWNCLLCSISSLCWIRMGWISTFWIFCGGQRLKKLWPSAQDFAGLAWHGFFHCLHLSPGLQLCSWSGHQFNVAGTTTMVFPPVVTGLDSISTFSAASRKLHWKFMATKIRAINTTFRTKSRFAKSQVGTKAGE